MINPRAPRRRREEKICAAILDALEGLVLEAYGRLIGCALSDVAVDGYPPKPPRR